MQDFHQQNSKNFQRCLAYLRASAIGQNDEELVELIDDFDQNPLAIKLLISYLQRWHNGQLSGLEHIPVLHLPYNNNQRQGHGLKRLLVAFECQLRGCAELTLLYLLSLSNKPVLLGKMERLFQHSLLKRMLSRGDYRQFLAPLSTLNSRGWDEVIRNLYQLHLLGLSDSAEGQLLHVEDSICQHFRESLAAQKYNILQYAYADMMLVSGTAAAYGFPQRLAESSAPHAHVAGIMPPNYGLPPEKIRRSNNRDVSKVDIHGQLRALRYRLSVLKAQSRELNTLMSQSPACHRRLATKQELIIQPNSQVA